MPMGDIKEHSKDYFAAAPAPKCAATLSNRIEIWTNNLESNGFLDKLRCSWAAYHGAYYTDVTSGHMITFAGVEGELANLPINHIRNIAQHILVMTTNARPTMEARSTNTDYKSLTQTVLANGLLDYYMREKRLERYLKVATEYAIVLGAGFIKMAWNATSGQMYEFNEETQTPIYEGDVEFTNMSPFDIVMDTTKEGQDHDWYICRTWKNRFDLAAKYPELATKILSLPTKSEMNRFRFNYVGDQTTDDIPVYEFYHKRTECMPDGRYMLFLTDTIIPYDGPLPYRVLPIFRIAPGDILGTPFGYTNIFDLLPIQEAVNSLYSSVLSNQNAFGVQNILVPRGADIAFNQLSGGLNIIEANIQAGKPEPLELCSTPPEIFKFMEILERVMETISGVNSVARGNPEASLKSGAALALVQSMALQFMSGLQQSYVELIEDVGTALILMLQDFASVPRVAAIVGRSHRTEMKEFNGDDLNSIHRIVVDVGNPLARCLAKDTPVLMHDGSIKKVQYISIGDQIMGSDSGPRTVNKVNSGTEMMYEVTSKDIHREIKYGCNESHILTLKYCSDDYRYDAKKGDILDISIKDYLLLPERQKRLLQGFTTGVEFEKKNLPIPAYILGAWLGDGHSAVTALTSMDKELVDEWTNYAHSIGMLVRVQENRQPNKSKVYFITSGQSHGSSDRNPFMNELRELELVNNKHIPDIYLRGSREDRLNLLAGLIDTDGYRLDETFIFTQKNERLSKEVIHLAKSLGFRVTSKKVKSSSSKLVGELNTEVFKITIGGNTNEIPNRLPRKQAKEKYKVRDWLNYGINVECKGIGTYYGFTLEEEPHFLLGDFTVTHNTTAGRVQMAEQMLQMGLIKTPNEYFTVMNTGNLDVMNEGTQAQTLLIRDENEKMLGGETVPVLLTDFHKDHILEHSSILADTDLRKDQRLCKIVLDHLQEHIKQLQTGDPNLLGLMGQQPLSPPPAAPAAPSGPPGVGSPPKNGVAAQQPPNPGAPPKPAGPPSPGLPNANIPQVPKPPAPFQNQPTQAAAAGGR
jgi:hypothetical protein